MVTSLHLIRWRISAKSGWPSASVDRLFWDYWVELCSSLFRKLQGFSILAHNCTEQVLMCFSRLLRLCAWVFWFPILIGSLILWWQKSRVRKNLTFIFHKKMNSSLYFSVRFGRPIAALFAASNRWSALQYTFRIWLIFLSSFNIILNLVSLVQVCYRSRNTGSL